MWCDLYRFKDPTRNLNNIYSFGTKWIKFDIWKMLKVSTKYGAQWFGWLVNNLYHWRMSIWFLKLCLECRDLWTIFYGLGFERMLTLSWNFDNLGKRNWTHVWFVWFICKWKRGCFSLYFVGTFKIRATKTIQPTLIVKMKKTSPS